MSETQPIQGMLVPAGAIVFFGDHEGSLIESIGLMPSTRLVIGGVAYDNSSGGATLFVDFDENGKVKTVR